LAARLKTKEALLATQASPGNNPELLENPLRTDLGLPSNPLLATLPLEIPKGRHIGRAAYK
jgi:hypothetical protein